MISFTRISKQYGRQILFVDASFQLNPGDKVGLVGPNGSGKSTTLRCLAGLESAQSGRIDIAATTVEDTDHGIDVPPLRRAVGDFIPG